MATSPMPPPVTPEEYLAHERRADARSEYLDGQVYTMARGSPEHNIITVNLLGELRDQLKGTPCQVFSSDMKVRTALSGLFSYPDASVVCGEPTYHDEHRDVLTNPTVIIEVLSPTTEAFDRGKKFARYQTISTLTDYVLIAQDEPRVEHFLRQAGGAWLLTVVTGLSARLDLPSICCRLDLAEIYDRIQFTAPDALA